MTLAASPTRNDSLGEALASRQEPADTADEQRLKLCPGALLAAVVL